MTMERINRMVEDLANRLEKNPEDTKGWVMLGRSYKTLGRMPEAIRAFERAGDAMTTPALILLLAGGLGMLVARAWERSERLHALAAVPVGGSGRRGRERPWHPVV